MSEIPLEGMVGIAICLLFSAFFSGSETALTSLSPANARRLMEEAGRRGEVLSLWVDDPLRVLTTILVGNNVFNIAASAIATAVAVEVLEPLSASVSFINPVAIAVGVMTLLLLTFGEITPKTLAKANAERLAIPILLLLRPIVFLLMPVTALFIGLSRTLAERTGTDLEPGGPFVREEDIEYLVRLGGREGSLSQDRERLLRSVFEFTDTTAREVMVPRTDVFAVPADASEADLLAQLLAAGHSRVPVYEGAIDNIIGLCYAKDLLRFVGQRTGSETFEVARFLRRANFVPETKPISELLREMQENRIHMAIVVDEFGGFSGLVTLEDIIEEFFGDILDEYDVESDWIVEVTPGRWRVDARIGITDLGELLRVDIPDIEDCDTLGGYLSKAVGEVAAAGAVVEEWGLRFTVEDADERRVKQVCVERFEPPDPDEAPVDTEET